MLLRVVVVVEGECWTLRPKKVRQSVDEGSSLEFLLS